MSRIGVFIDTMCQTIPIPFREEIGSLLKKIPEISFILEEDDLTSYESIQRMAKRLEDSDVSRVLIIGGSPKIYESSFQKFCYPTSLNPYLFMVANIREQVLWVLPQKDALERAKDIIQKSIRMLSFLKPIKTEAIPLKPDVLVIGGGISGISTALALAKSGIHVNLIEKDQRLGGYLNELRIFYQDLEDAHKWIEEKISEASKNQNIDILTRGELVNLKGHIGRFEAKIRKFDGTEFILNPSVIVVAIGYERETERKGIYAHKRVKSFSEMEKLISEANGPSLYIEGIDIQTITFMIDSVNEDIKIDSINAIKQALILQEKFQCQAVILCKDVKVSSERMERLYRRAREAGVLFFKYDEPPRLSLTNGQFQIDIKDTSV
ncbi:MAG: FAD-dependent oxidoreductase, partial [Methanothermobacter tenebrarum]